MFHLIKILNGRIGVPEPERITLETSVNVKYGTPVIIKDGSLEVMSGISISIPTHYILKDSSGNEVLAGRITPDTIFEVPAAGTPSAMKVGTEYILGSNGTLTAAPVTAGKRGAVLVSTAGAKKVGDPVHVCFR